MTYQSRSKLEQSRISKIALGAMAGWVAIAAGVPVAMAQDHKADSRPVPPPAQAQQTGTPIAPVAAPNPAPATAQQTAPSPAPATARLALASVVVPGEKVADGDYVSSSRYYGDWRLACDEIVSRGRRICRLEQELGSGGRWALSWKLVESAQKKPFFLVQFPASANPTTGVSLIVGGFNREFRTQEWACSGAMCEIYIPADTTAQQLILGATNIRFRYGLGSEAVELAASMNGFSAALDALTDDPAPVAVAAAAPAPQPVKVADRRKPTRERQFESIRRPSDPVPDALKKIYGVN